MAFELLDAQPQGAVIKVVGVGGCGGNAVDHAFAKADLRVQYTAPGGHNTVADDGPGNGGSTDVNRGTDALMSENFGLECGFDHRPGNPLRHDHSHTVDHRRRAGEHIGRQTIGAYHLDPAMAAASVAAATGGRGMTAPAERVKQCFPRNGFALEVAARLFYLKPHVPSLPLKRVRQGQ